MRLLVLHTVCTALNEVFYKLAFIPLDVQKLLLGKKDDQTEGQISQVNSQTLTE